MGIVSETWNLRVLLLLSPPGHTQPLSSTSKAPARAGEAEAPSPSGFTHWQAQADSAPGVTVGPGGPGPFRPLAFKFSGPHTPPECEAPLRPFRSKLRRSGY